MVSVVKVSRLYAPNSFFAPGVSVDVLTTLEDRLADAADDLYKGPAAASDCRQLRDSKNYAPSRLLGLVLTL